MRNSIITKSMLIWLGIIPLAILNGALREAVLIPALGSIGLPISGIILGVLAFVFTYIFIACLGRGSSSTYIKMGLIWIVATIIFEFTLGFATGDSLESMLAAYNIFTGNLWLFVVIFIGCTPWLAAKAKKVI